MIEKVRSGAGFLAIAGVVSIGLSLVGYNLRILMWIDLWGDLVGWFIRGGLVVVGLALFFLLPGETPDEAPEGSTSE